MNEIKKEGQKRNKRKIMKYEWNEKGKKKGKWKKDNGIWIKLKEKEKREVKER